MNNARGDIWIKHTLKRKHKADARLDIYISKDYMTAKAGFFPARANGEPFTKEYLDAALAAAGICYGVEYKALDDAAADCDTDGTARAGVVIARGTAPVDESAAYFKIDPALSAARLPRELKDGVVDFRAVTPYISVEAGREIARLQDAVAGKPGRTVTGVETPFKTIPRRPFVEGEGIYIQNDHMYAKTGGLLIIEENRIRVERVLRIQGAVGYATGNILFAGDLVLDGAVSDGFTVRSGGSITTRGAFTVSDCVSRGDLHVSGGLIGRMGGMVRVGGALRARFIWNCKIACKENVTVTAEVINSTIWTLGVLDLGRKGCLSTSEVYALRGVCAGSVGRPAARAVKIRLGTDWAAERGIAKDERTLRILKKKFEEIKARLAAAGPAQAALLRDAGLRIHNEYKKIQNGIIIKRKNLTSDSGASLTVYGMICAGTCIEIGNIRHTLQADARAVRFTLDTARRAIIPRPL